jgi:hypothetical protein
MAERKNILLRLDPAVYDAVAKWAADDLRSVNAQIEYALRHALRSAGRPPTAPRVGGASTEPRVGDTTTAHPARRDDPDESPPGGVS